MNNKFFIKLALGNLKKNSKTYVPYILTCIFSIVTFFVMDELYLNEELQNIRGAAQLNSVLGLGKVIIAILAAIFLFYTNSFLIKRRKKDIGIYNVLGMEKKHIAIVISFETMIIAIVSFVLGIIIGVVFGKLFFLILLKMMKLSESISFPFVIDCLIDTAIVFIVIFTVILFTNIFQVIINKPIELLKAREKGEKEPKSSWFLASIGFILLIIGYYKALIVESPLESINEFFFAVLFVIAGTYMIFMYGSIIILKMLKKNKKFYYKKNNFISVSGMIYRMKQNAAGLASICILSTTVLVTLTTTVSVYTNMESSLKLKYPQDVKSYINNLPEEDFNNFINVTEKCAEKHNVNIEDESKYNSINFLAVKNDNTFILDHEDNSLSEIYYMNYITVLTLDDYNKIENLNLSLNEDEAFIFSIMEDYKYDTIILDKKEFKVSKKLDNFRLMNKNKNDLMNHFVLIVKDMNVLKSIQGSEAINKISLNRNLDYNLSGTEEDIINFSNEMQSYVSNFNNYMFGSIYSDRQEFYAMNGGLIFIGIFLGILFIFATVLIIYYKQISEGYDDSYRFEVMHKVGMSSREIKKTINKQILMVFFIPPLVAIVHMIFASKMILKILAIIEMYSVSTFVISTICTIIGFLVIYVIVYKLTANVYYKIVK